MAIDVHQCEHNCCVDAKGYSEYHTDAEQYLERVIQSYRNTFASSAVLGIRNRRRLLISVIRYSESCSND